MENKNRLFRKAKFGGFNKEDVMQYIETMKTEFFDYKAQVEETIRELNERLALFEHGDEPAEKPASDFGDGNALSINEATEHLKQVADELCEKMSRLLGRMQTEDAEEAEADSEPALPETPQDKVQALLGGLFTGKKDEKPQTAAPKTFALDDIFPAYTKKD